MKCIFEQFLSATTIPSVALVSAPSTMPSCFLKTYTYKQSYIYKPQLSTLVWENQCWPSPVPPTIYPPKKCWPSPAPPKNLLPKILSYTYRIQDMAF